MPHSLKGHFKSLLPGLYSSAIIILLILRTTPLNRCGSTGSIFVGCIGFLDFLIAVLVFPGLIVWQIFLELPPSSYVLKQLNTVLNSAGIHDFIIYLIVGWLFGLLVHHITGVFIDKRMQKKS